jgi:hypothetical protein
MCSARFLRVLSAVLDHLTSKERIKSFLSKLPPTYGPYISGARVKDVRVNKLARAGSPLYERFLDAMVRHVAELGGEPSNARSAVILYPIIQCVSFDSALEFFRPCILSFDVSSCGKFQEL